jgi:hypothetical protein
MDTEPGYEVVRLQARTVARIGRCSAVTIAVPTAYDDEPAAMPAGAGHGRSDAARGPGGRTRRVGGLFDDLGDLVADTARLKV